MEENIKTKETMHQVLKTKKGEYYPISLSIWGKTVVGEKTKMKVFVRGKGWKSVTGIIEETEYESCWNTSWLEVCKIYSKYGHQVALEFADKLTAGIVAEQTMMGYMFFGINFPRLDC